MEELPETNLVGRSRAPLLPGQVETLDLDGLLERFQTAMEMADGESDDEPPLEPAAEESKPAAKAKGKKGKKGRE